MKKVAFLGPEGTYTHQAAEKYFESYEAVPCTSVKEVVKSGANAAVIPFENSLGGGVDESIDLLRDEEVNVTGEVKVQISHVLASRDSDGVNTVVSHPQALSQCRGYIEDENLATRETASTAKAAQEISEGEAALCSRKAAEINNLEIVEEDVQDTDSNTTRFLVLNGESASGDKTSIVLEPSIDRPGLLESMLSCFSGHGINLAYVQSRPTRGGLGSYYFYVEAEADQESENMKKALECLETYADIQVLGSYEEAEP